MKSSEVAAPPQRRRRAPAAPPLEAVTGVVLCGGGSERMGRDKARLRLEGRSLVETAAAALRPVASRVVLACGASPRYRDLGLDLALDRDPADERGDGPLAGLRAGLEAARTEWIAAVACDLPRARADLFEGLLLRAAQRDLDACLFESRRGLEPLLGVYRRTCLEPLRAALASGQRRVTAFFDRETAGRGLRIGRLREPELGPELAGWDPAVNLNTPEDYDAEAAARAAGEAAER